MPRLTLLLIATTVLLQAAPAFSPPDSVPREPDRWLGMDKFWHFSASFVSVGAGYHLFANRIGFSHETAAAAASAGTITLGISKEFYDLLGRERHFSWKDIVADLCGIGAGYLVFVHQWR